MERLLRRAPFVLSVLSLLTAVACGKKCQQTPTTPFTSITATQWRLVSTTSPDARFKGLNNYNFEIWQFAMDGTGTVNRVVNNDEFNTPFFTFTYQLNTSDGRSGQMVANFTAGSSSSSTTGGSTGGSTGGTPQPGLGGSSGSGGGTSSQSIQVEYTYQLGTELNMTDQNGNSYRFVQFTGVIAPDDICTF